MLNNDLDIRCPRCGKLAKLKTWNELTYSMCSTREMKRAYTQLYEKKAFKQESNAFYICPNCNQWSRGSQLKIVNTDDKELLKLGGRSILFGKDNKKHN